MGINTEYSMAMPWQHYQKSQLYFVTRCQKITQNDTIDSTTLRDTQHHHSFSQLVRDLP